MKALIISCVRLDGNDGGLVPNKYRTRSGMHYVSQTVFCLYRYGCKEGDGRVPPQE